MLKPDGSAAEIELARPAAWVESQEATVGGAIWLDLPEMGISGWAEVGSIGKRPDPGPRPSPRHSLVTATFKYTSDQVVRLQVSGEAQSLGVTASHPIWSVDRGEFVEVGALDQGERVLGLAGGEHLVAAILPRPGPTAVYNLEVYGAHVYHVGASGLLAHNMCAAERAGTAVAHSPWAKVSADVLRARASRAYSVTYPRVTDRAQRIAARTRVNPLEVHHRIPLEYRHLFHADPNRLSNLVGIHKDVHAEISGLWSSFRLANAKATRVQVFDFASRIDSQYGRYYNSLNTNRSLPSFR